MLKKQKTFSFHWGSGVVAEEAQVEGRYHTPTLQLLKYTEGDTNEHVSIRFCYYSHSGHFARSPLVMSYDEIEDMRAALQQTPELLAVLRRLVT